jgi:hypothetical protein
VRQDLGYLKPPDFWELPNWVAILRHNISEADFCVVRNINDFVEFINASKYHYICFSVLEANKKPIREIVDRYAGIATFALGGHPDLDHYFAGYDNVAIFDSLKKLSALIGGYEFGFNYSDFEGVPCIPRLISEEQVRAFDPLQFKLVYVGKNYRLVPKVGEIKERNEQFEGIILRGSTDLDPALLSSVKFLEVDVEQIERFAHLGIKLVPNVTVGLGTKDNYLRALGTIRRHRESISHMNICVLNNEGEPHRWFHNEIFNLGLDLLN